MLRRSCLSHKHKGNLVVDKKVQVLWRSYQKKDAGHQYSGFLTDTEDFGAAKGGGGSIDYPLLMERPYPIAELSKRMVRIQMKFENSEDTKERQLLRGEYKYFTGKKADLRGALISDCLAILQVNCFFEFWHAGLVEEMLGMLTQCVHELTPEECLELLVALPKLQGDRYMVHPLWRHAVDSLLPVLEDLSFDDTMRILEALKDTPGDKMPELVDGCLLLMAATWEPSMRLSLKELVLMLQTVAAVPYGRRRHFLLPHSPFSVYLARATIDALPEMDDAVDVGDFLQAADILRLFEENALELPDEIRPMNQPVARLSSVSFHPDEDSKRAPEEFQVPAEEVRKNDEYRREVVLEQVRRGIFLTPAPRQSPRTHSAENGELEVALQEGGDQYQRSCRGADEVEEDPDDEPVRIPSIFLKEGSCKALSFALYSLCCDPSDKLQMTASISAVVRAQDAVLLRLPAFTVAELFAVAATYATHAIYQQELTNSKYAKTCESRSSRSSSISSTRDSDEVSSSSVLRCTYNATLDGFLNVLYEVFERMNKFLTLSQSQLEPELLVSYLQIVSQLYSKIPRDRLPFCTLNLTVKELSGKLISNHPRFDLKECVRFALLLPTLPSGLLDAAVQCVIKQLARTAKSEKDPAFAAKAHELLVDHPYFTVLEPDTTDKSGGGHPTTAASSTAEGLSRSRTAGLTRSGTSKNAFQNATGLSIAQRLELSRAAKTQEAGKNTHNKKATSSLPPVMRSKGTALTPVVTTQPGYWKQSAAPQGKAGLQMKKLQPKYMRIIHQEVLPALRRSASGVE